MKTDPKSLGLLCALSLSFFACSREGERAPATARDEQPAMTPAALTRSAAQQIAEARCEREQACGNVGDDKTHPSVAECSARIQDDWKEDLNARQCPGGINQAQLNECMTKIRAEDCGNPFDTLARITECTSNQICIE